MKKMMPPAMIRSGVGMCHLSSNVMPMKPPAIAAITASTNARRAMPRIAAGSSPRVSWANGPRIFSGPSVTKNSVNTVPSEISASGVLGISLLPLPLSLADRVDIAIQEESEERADHGDGRDPPDLSPGRCDRGFDDVRGELKRECRRKPARELEPDGAPGGTRTVRVGQQAEQADHGPDDPDDHDYDRDRLDRQRHVIRDVVQEFFHSCYSLRMETERNTLFQSRFILTTVMPYSPALSSASASGLSLKSRS